MTHCSICATAREGDRLPRGWKRAGDEVYCDACWRARYVLRAITVPVAGPVDGTWAELRDTLRERWRDATVLSNWAVQALLRADAVRTPATEKLPSMPRVYLYPGAREVVPDMDPQSITALLRSVERRYRADRYAVIWQRAKAPPSYRYPAPYPVHNQAWHAEAGPDNTVQVSVRLAGARRVLRLRGGARHARQLKAVRQLIDGGAVGGELALYERGTDLMCKMVMWLPREMQQRERKGVLYVRTGGDALLTYRVDQEEPRHYHADHARRWQAEHARRLQRTSDDAKEERRHDKRHRSRSNTVRRVWARKYADRMSSLTHEASAIIAGYADRRNTALVVYDDTDKSYIPAFPWHQLRERLAYKLDDVGLKLEFASGGEVGDSASPLEGEVA